jgi:hypothetical protein
MCLHDIRVFKYMTWTLYIIQTSILIIGCLFITDYFVMRTRDEVLAFLPAKRYTKCP